MAWYDFLFGGKTKALVGRANNYSMDFMTATAQTVPIYPNREKYDIGKTYTTIDDVYSIINKLSDVCAGIPFYPYLEANDAEVSKYRKILKHLPKQVHASIKRKALQDVSENDIVYDLLTSPSSTLSAYEFYKACFAFIYLHEECVLMKDRLDLGVNAGKYNKFHILYPQFLVLNVTQTFPQQIVSYDYVINGITIHKNIPVENIIHYRGFNPNYDAYGSELRGVSPLKIALKRLTRLTANMDASVAQLQNGGTPSIVYEKGDGVDATNTGIIDNRKDNFYKFLHNKSNKGAPYFAMGEMGVIHLGLKLTDMEVSALADVDFDKLCNIWGVSSTLFNSKAANTESNVKEQKKSMYTDVVIPKVKQFLSVLQNEIRKDFGKPYILDIDMDAIPELQEDSKAKAETLNAAPIMIPKYVLEALGYEVDDTDENLSKVYVKNGYSLLDDLNGVADLPLDGTGN